MNEDANSAHVISKRLPLVIGVGAGILAAIFTGIIINTTFPRTSFGLDIIHPPQAVTVIIPAGAEQLDNELNFMPTEIRVILGVNNTVVWVNENSTPDRLVAEDEKTQGGFGKTKNLIPPSGGTFAFTFTDVGVFKYFSDINPWLTGSVVVRNAEKSNIELVNSVSAVYPEVTVLREKIEVLDGVHLAQVTATSQSDSIQRTAAGFGKTVSRHDQAELILSHTRNSDDSEVVAVTVTNTGAMQMYVVSLLITGATDGGLAPVVVHAIDDDYSPQVWGDIQKPAVIEPMQLGPGESVTAYITGKWNIAAAGNEPITTFSVGAGYTYDPTVTEYKEGNNWSISITDVMLP